MSSPAGEGGVSVISVPEVRDYQKINAEIAQRLDAGAAVVRLAGTEGQRLLVAGLSGSWTAVVEVEGPAGPELAAELDAPGVIVLALGSVADGAGRGLRAGRLLILGDAGEALGYAQRGGAIVAAKGAAPRAGLNQRGGTIVVLGDVGRLAGERQRGGLFFAHSERLGPHAGRGRRAGRFVELATGADPSATLERDEAAAWSEAMGSVAPWIAKAGF